MSTPSGGHVLAVRLDAFGDLLVTGPAVRALRSTADRVTLLCGPRGRAAAALLPGVDDVVTWPAPWIEPTPAPVDPQDVDAVRSLVADLDVDRAVVFTSFHQSPLPTALVLKTAGVPWVGAVSRDYAGSLLDLRLRPAGPHGTVPEPEAQLRLALACGGELPPGDDGRLRVEVPARRPVHGSAYVVLHPGTSVPARAWAPERFRDACALLVEAGHGVVVTGSTDERSLTAYVAGGSPEAVDLGGRTDPATLASVLAGADAVVAGNTGPAHLAAAVGTPVVSLFAPTVPATCWAPYGVPVELLGDQDAPCAGTRATDCPVAGHPCLNSVSADDVVAAVERAVTPAMEGAPR
jgi:ADP-heptose:LPS heptosyltransferase